MNDLKPKPKVPFIDWLLFVTNFTWAFGLYLLVLKDDAPNGAQLAFRQTLFWFGIVGTIAIFFVRMYLNRKQP